jgi:hypothetical protein
VKTRVGFVSNSSSSSFIITNKSADTRDLVSFVLENPQLIERFCKEYDWHKAEDGYNQEKLLESAEQNNVIWQPKERRSTVFGDEDNTLIGCVFDYILRDGGESKNWKWRFERSLR